MAENHGVPEARQLPRVWTRGRKETDNCQRASGAKSPWTVQNEMRNVLEWVPTSAARKILDSFNPREIEA